MKKETRKQANDRELKVLAEKGLTDAELHVIRKLNGATSVPGYEGYSRRTIEAVLQGRRSNIFLLQKAIQSAKEQLDRYTRVMDQILKKLSGSNDTTQD